MDIIQVGIIPFPVAAPPGGNHILLETGDNLALENGDLLSPE